MDEPFGPEYVRPPQKDCPDCPCCTVDLCKRGRTSLLECVGFTADEHKDTVYGCPCSTVTTPHTAAWRAGLVRVTRLAREMPIGLEAEALLAVLADGQDVDADGELFAQLAVRGLATRTDDLRPVITDLGRTYLAARDDERATAAVQVVDVDKKDRIALVEVAAWRPEEPVTVLLDQVTADTGLSADELPEWLAAEANCHAPDTDRLVLTGFSVTPDPPQGWTDGESE
ncbi:hypothetical protein [Streptomyces boncukensis]|uniref:Uncharacterized protein n=1 Tax=Streptomyces boncukensis TaxID=2711219 RepID=A0A6G4WT69_9ACTN|nr:hypothetical protein [Streptomyces boncukensis]NGO67840.1 hypothetical protein [Streptomyces boncukensis]